MGSAAQARAREARRDQGAVLIGFGRGGDQAEQAFLARFEPHGDGFLFRPTATGAPVRISRAERDAEAAAFSRWARTLFWLLVGGMIVVAAILASLFPSIEGDALDRTIWYSVPVMVALFGGGWWWGWQRPTRRFARRAPAGSMRTIHEARIEALRQIGWGQLALSVVIGLYLATGALDGEIVWPIIGGIVLVAGGIQATRKLLLERRAPR